MVCEPFGDRQSSEEEGISRRPSGHRAAKLLRENLSVGSRHRGGTVHTVPRAVKQCCAVSAAARPDLANYASQSVRASVSRGAKQAWRLLSFSGVGRREVSDRILIVSDSSESGTDGSLCVAADREEAATALAEGGVRAICLDRRTLEDALADARWLRRRRNRLPVLALVETTELPEASELFGLGVEELIVRNASARANLIARVDSLQPRAHGNRRPRGVERIVARSPAMRAVLQLVEKAQRSRATVLIQGETGTGKEVIARALHEGGRDRRAPFVALNCAAFPETLLESELFGAERGAFTGATRSRAGHFEQANRGTLFLDEIGETSLGFQVKLLRALQEGVIRRLGGTREVRVDVRIVAATNRELEHAVELGEFRRDLYYRLNVFPIFVPPLRARCEDIVPLTRQFLESSPDNDSLRDVSEDAARLLETYTWPGNVRELENEVARIIAHAAGEAELTARMLSAQIRDVSPALPGDGSSESLRETMARFEAWVLRRALEGHGQRCIVTARSLGIRRECLYK